MQIFRPRANTIARVVLVGIVAVPLGLALLIMGAWRSTWATRVDVYVEQTVPFSHKHHVGELNIDCRYCHTGVEQSSYAGLPPTHTCMSCHSQLWTNADMLAPVRQSLAQDRPLKWNRVHDLPDYVYFNHSIHVAKGVGCTTCHGQVDEMPLMQKANTLFMSWCLECHREPEKYLRPKERVFDTDYHPPADQEALGRRLVGLYNVQKWRLTDCSVCHR